MLVLKLAQDQSWAIIFHTVAKCGVRHQSGASNAQAPRTNSAVLDSDDISQCKGKHGLTAVLSCWHTMPVRPFKVVITERQAAAELRAYPDDKP